jgi:hypothetical protein
MKNKPNSDTKISAGTPKADEHQVKSAEKAAVGTSGKPGQPKKA